MDQFYYEEGYIEAGYHTYIAEGILAPYIEPEYIERYYWQDGTLYIDATVIAEGQILAGEDVFGEASLSAAFAASCQAGIIFEASSNQTATFSQSCTISHIEGADLFAFTEAELAAIVARLRDINVSASSAFDIATDYIRYRDISSDINSESTVSSVIERSRAFSAETQAAFSFAASLDGTIEAASSQVSEFSISITAAGTQRFDADLTSEFTLAATISHIEGADLTAFADANLTASVDKIKSADAALSSEFNQTTDVEKTFGIIESLVSTASLSATVRYDVRPQIRLVANVLVDSIPSIYSRTLVTDHKLESPRYKQYAYSSANKKFGTHSISLNDTGTRISPNSVLFDGSNFRAFTVGYSWSSSDGINWTRTTNNLASFTGATGNVLYEGGQFLSSSSTQVLTSSDGLTWSGTTVTVGGQTVTSVRKSGSTYYTISGTRSDVYSATSLTGTWTNLTNNGSTAAASNLHVGSKIFWSVFVSGTFSGFGGTTLPPTLTIPSGYQIITGSLRSSSTTWAVALRQTSAPYQTRIYYSTGGTFTNYVAYTNREYKNYWFENNLWMVATTQGIYSGSSLASLSLGYSFKTQRVSSLTYGNSKYLGASVMLTNSLEAGDVLVGSSLSNLEVKPIAGCENLYPKLSWSSNDLNSWSTIDFWHYNNAKNDSFYKGVSYVFDGKELNVGQISSTQLALYYPSTSTSNADGNSAVTSATNVLPANTWSHIRISRSGSNLSVYANGTRIFNYSDLDIATAAASEIRFSGLNPVDELLVSDQLKTDPSVSSFSVPTKAWTNDSNTDLLIHFDNSLQDDSLFQVDPASKMSARFEVKAIVQKIKYGAADLSSEFTTSADVDAFRFVDAAADLAASVSLTVDADRVRYYSSSISSNFNLSASADKFRPFSSNQSAEFSQTTAAIKTAVVESSQTAAVTVTATISHIHGADLTAFADAALALVFERIRDHSSTAVSEFSQSSNVSVVTDVISNQSSEFAQTSTVDRTRGVNSNQSSEFAQTSTVDRTRDVNVSLSADFAVNAEINRFRDFDSSLNSESNLNFSIGRIINAEIATDAVASQLTAVAKIGDFFVVIEVAATISVDAVKVAEFSSSQSSEFAQDAVYSIVRNVDAILAAAASTSAIVYRIKQGQSNLNATSQLSATAIKTGFNSIVASSEFAFAVIGSKFVGVDSAQSSEFAQTVDFDRFRSIISAQSSEFAQMAAAIITAEAASNQSSEFTLAATISHIEGADIVAENFATLAIDAFVGKVASSNINSEFTQTTDNLRVRFGDSAQSSEFNQSAAVGIIYQGASDQNSAFSTSQTGNRTASAVSNQTAVSSLSCTISHIEGADIVAENFAAMTINGEILVGFAVTATSTANLTATAVNLRGFRSDQAASTSLVANAVKVHRGQAQVQATATISANATRILQGSVAITSAMTFVAEVREIDIDSVNQVVYKIAREEWTYKIPADIRSWTVQEETRIYIIKEE